MAGSKYAPDKDIDAAVRAQMGDLDGGLKKQVDLDALVRELNNLKTVIGGVPGDASDKILTSAISLVSGIVNGSGKSTDIGNALGDLDTLLQLSTTGSSAQQILQTAIVQLETALNLRPDVDSILQDLEAVKSLRGGPADATAFHDFHILQIAFKDVWQHAFDKNVEAYVEQAYIEHTKLYEDAGITLPPFGAISDISDFEELIGFSPKSIATPSDIPLTQNPDYDPSKVLGFMGKTIFDFNTVPAMVPVIDQDKVISTFSAGWTYWQLSPEQQCWVWELAAIVNDPSKTAEEKADAGRKAQIILNNPEGAGGRLVKLLYKLGLALAEPYAFDVFAPNTYNFGIMVTYRQKWEPGEYQAGDLVSTIPLAPGETRKYSKRVSVKRTRTVKEIEKSMSSSSFQTNETSRAEAEIMKKASTATNFKMSADGSFNIGIGSVNSSTEFGLNQSAESQNNKKEFHEATVKAAQEFRLERSLEVDSSSVFESDETTSGEISNPNNEITVTYLFYELQRRFNVSEYLYRVRPVVLIALDVPAPHDIDEAWLLQYQWILSRVLLDDSFRPALDYLSSGFGGDETSLQIIKSNWEVQKNLVDKLEKAVDSQLATRDELREALINTTEQEDVARAAQMPTAMKVFTFGVDPSEKAVDVLEAQRKAVETRLQYMEQALADAQGKLKQATDSFHQATKDYAAAMQNKNSRHLAIDQLRVHVKQNIIYYMQAIWSHRVSDQTFFELYKLPVDCPEPASSTFTPSSVISRMKGEFEITGSLPAPSSTWHQHQLVEMADIDNPLGFKGNYIIFPLREDKSCHLTDYMLQDFIDEATDGLKDPDKIAYFLENFERLWLEAGPNGTARLDDEQLTRQQLKDRLAEYVETAKRSSEEIIVPTGQLFIEALPGSHPLLEDFKLLHRVEDVRKVRAEVRHAELENLRLASRILSGQLDDPDIDKKIVVDGNGVVIAGTN